MANGKTRFDLRQCFHPVFGHEENPVVITAPVMDRESQVNLYEQGQTLEEMSAEKFLDSFISQVKKLYPDMSTMDIIKRFCRGTCPKGFMTQECGDLIEAEAFCREYRVSPLGAEVGFLDYPRKLVDAFGVISIARERVRAAEMKREQSKSAPVNPGKGRA